MPTRLPSIERAWSFTSQDEGVEPEASRPATHEDVNEVAALAADRRRDYETRQPRFWRQADDALVRLSPA